ncbi:MAG: UDP-N-acetylmuramoyl-L-alanine--D-glutamate ligase [Candidatus Nealsonbacteria bacterium]|nr:UDP-N-acetylmuramoyl-L-alanine--D-glutamate ligase [Candidatus Nealsonbacteria bacterium]
MKIENLRNKKILILGLAREGIDTLVFLQNKFPDQKIGIADKNEKIELDNPKNTILHLGDDYLKHINDYDVIIKSPGVSLNLIQPYLKKNQIVTSQADIFLSNCKGLVIGITGTKGKSTTSTLIYKILKAKGLKSFLVGNIGKPALSYLLKDQEDRIYIYELSSFQLETITKGPQVAIILNFFKDHLDQHKNLEEYFNAKKKITSLHDNDFLIFNSKDPQVKKMALGSKAQKIPFDPNKDRLKVKNKLIISGEPIAIIGEMFGVPKNLIISEINKFKPLKHRLEYVGKYKGIEFYNDSAATIPEAAISAIDKLGQKLDTIIVGGVNKGFSTKELSEAILNSNIRNVILFPETGKQIEEDILKSKKKVNLFNANDMKEAVKICFSQTKKEGICLLSPAASSFNMFKSYKQRGNLFKRNARK